VSEATLAKHRAAIVKLIAASNRGWRTAIADIPATAKFVVEKTNLSSTLNIKPVHWS